jgi:diphthamide biosynthesis protein 3
MVYEEVDIDDMDFDEEQGLYTYECPCGDLFQISEEELAEGEEIAYCPSCSLVIRVLYDPDDFAHEEPAVEEGASALGAASEPEPEPEPEVELELRAQVPLQHEQAQQAYTRLWGTLAQQSGAAAPCSRDLYQSLHAIYHPTNWPKQVGATVPTVAATMALAQMGEAGWERRRAGALQDGAPMPEPGGWEREMQGKHAADQARRQRLQTLQDSTDQTQELSSELRPEQAPEVTSDVELTVDPAAAG